MLFGKTKVNISGQSEIERFQIIYLGCQSYTREVLVYESSLMRSWIANTIENYQNMPPAQPENSEISPNEILETVQSVFDFLGGVFNFLAE